MLYLLILKLSIILLHERFKGDIMGINLLLRKEGLENIRKLNTLQINKIASYIADKLCKSFPELHLSQSALFIPNIKIRHVHSYYARRK